MKIKETTDYGKFKFINGNRDVDTNHVNQIVKSMERKFLIRPIDVTDDMEVIDGQHRLTACEILGKPVYYIIHDKYDFADVHILNQNQKNWGLLDFVKSYAKKGNYNYILLLDFIEKYKITVTMATVLIRSWVRQSKDDIRLGTFETNQQDIEKAIETLEYIIQFKPYIDFYKSRNFIYAIKEILEVEGFEPKQLLRNCKKYNSLVKNCVSSRDMVQMLDNVYNYRRIDRLRLYK